MPKVGKNDDFRLNIRLRDDIKKGLDELSQRRYDDTGLPFALNRLVIEGTLMLLHHEGIRVGSDPARKPPRSAKGKRAAA